MTAAHASPTARPIHASIGRPRHHRGASALHNRLYDRLTRDPALGELRDGNTRLLLMRADAFMGAFARLDDDARYAMFAAFAQSIAAHSGQSAKHYRHELGPAAREIFPPRRDTPAPRWVKVSAFAERPQKH